MTDLSIDNRRRFHDPDPSTSTSSATTTTTTTATSTSSATPTPTSTPTRTEPRYARPTADHDACLAEMARANKDVMFLGMNEDTAPLHRKQSDAEWNQIDAIARHQHGHAVRIEASYSNVVGHDGRMFNLSQPGQARAFAEALGIPDPKVTNAIANAIENATPGGRDEIARMAGVWACAEKPGTPAERSVPNRVIVSGHCGPAGTTVYDGAVPDDFESKNKILFSDVQALGKAMPHAAAQVHDIMLSACSSLRPNQVHEWTDAFPSLCSIQGYGGPVDYHSPTGGLALAHEAVWLSDTRGAGAPHLRSDREISFASHVTLYTKAHGYEEAKK